MDLPEAAPRHTLAALLAVLGRPARFRIDARPGDREQPVTTAAAWACGCRAEGPAYQELLLAPCAAHALPEDDGTRVGSV
ncbi:MAG: hypothetical protein QOI11_568 [Candidatus Eremiobacteraeota bacterium]|nr:hypothetical protein [Candidatus Eremiobacteraeota bacterium]